MAGDARFIARMTDANTHAMKVVADMRIYGADAVMACRAAAGFDPQLTGRKIELVIEYDDVLLPTEKIIISFFKAEFLGHGYAFIYKVQLKPMMR